MSSAEVLAIDEELKEEWQSLYHIGSISAALVAIFIPIQIIVFILFPPPANILEWFDLFQKNPAIGLLDMDLLLILDQVLLGIILLALYINLRHIHHSYSLLSIVIGLMGIVAYFSSTIAFNMLTLSNDYATATSVAEKAAIETSGRTLLTMWTGTAYTIGYILLGIAILLVSIVMTKSSVFGKTTAYVGIATGILSLIPASFGIIGMIFAFASLIPMEIWLIRISKSLAKL